MSYSQSPITGLSTLTTSFTILKHLFTRPRVVCKFFAVSLPPRKSRPLGTRCQLIQHPILTPYRASPPSSGLWVDFSCHTVYAVVHSNTAFLPQRSGIGSGNDSFSQPTVPSSQRFASICAQPVHTVDSAPASPATQRQDMTQLHLNDLFTYLQLIQVWVPEIANAGSIHPSSSPLRSCSAQ